jgi:hypothetical protein
MSIWPIILIVAGAAILYAIILIQSDWLDEFLDAFNEDKDK